PGEDQALGPHDLAIDAAHRIGRARIDVAHGDAIGAAGPHVHALDLRSDVAWPHPARHLLGIDPRREHVLARCSEHARDDQRAVDVGDRGGGAQVQPPCPAASSSASLSSEMVQPRVWLARIAGTSNVAWWRTISVLAPSARNITVTTV